MWGGGLIVLGKVENMKSTFKHLMLMAAFICVLLPGVKSLAAAKKVTISNKKSVATMYRSTSNTTATLKFKIKGKAKRITVKSSKPSVVSVKKQSGTRAVLTAKKKGTAIITVKADKKKATVKVKVKQLVTKFSSSVKNPVAAYNGVYTIQKGKQYSIQNSFAKSPSSDAMKYKSSNSGVAKVSRTGKITSNGIGKAKVTITAKDKSKVSASFDVIVTKRIVKRVTDVKLSADQELTVGKTAVVRAAVAPADATLQTVVYKSLNTSVATVDKFTGMVTAKKAGTVKIEAQAMDGSKKKGTIKLRVMEAAVPYTKISAADNAETVTVRLTFAGNAAEVEKYVLNKLNSIPTATDAVRNVLVNGVLHTVRYNKSTGTFLYDNDPNRKIMDLANADGNVTMTVDAKLYEFALGNFGTITATNLFKECSFMIGNICIWDVTINEDGQIIFIMDGVRYNAFVEGGSFYIEGDCKQVIESKLTAGHKKKLRIEVVKK